jgi:mRNA interferase RelE/StbE
MTQPIIYSVEFAPSAARDFRKIPHEVQRRLARAIDALRVNPRPRGAKKLQAVRDVWRIRAGDYRIIYEIQERRLVVMVVRVAHRREAYRGPL